MTLGVLLAGFQGLGDQDHQTAMYLPALQAHPGFDIVAVTGDGRSAEAAAALGIPYLESLADALAHPDVDAVSVAVPPERRAEVLITAMPAGKAVLADKPLAADLADAEAIVAAQQRTGAVLTVAHHLRLQRDVQAAVPRLRRARSERSGPSRPTSSSPADHIRRWVS